MLEKNIDIKLTHEEQLFDFVTIKEHHTFLDYQNKHYPSQGWKIHLSCFFDNFERILDIVGRYCAEKKIAFKYVNKKSLLFELLSKHANRLSSGKFITIYPLNELEFTSCIRDLYILLKNEHGPYILTDKRYLDCKVLYYRYGVIQQNDLIDRGYIIDGEGNKVLDVEGPFYTEKKGITDPLSENKLEESPFYLFEKYTIEKALQHTNGGGIYIGIQNSTRKKVLIKEARPFIGLSITDTMIKFRKQETENLKYLSGLPFIPKVIESFYEWEHYYVVIEFIEGETLRNFSAVNSPVVFHESLKSTLKENIAKIDTVISNILKALFQLHNIGVALVDISPDNIIITKDLNIYFIDLEDCKINDLGTNNETYKVKNVQYSNSTISELNYYQQDKQKIGYLIMSILCSANELLPIDPTGELTLKVFNEFSYRYDIPSKIYEVVLNLIYNRDFDGHNSHTFNVKIEESINLLEDINNLEESINKIYMHNPILSDFCGLTYMEYSQEKIDNIENLSLINQSICILKNYVTDRNPKILDLILKKDAALKIDLEHKFTENKYSLSEGVLAYAYFYIKLYECTNNEKFLENTFDILMKLYDKSIKTHYGRLIPNSAYTYSPYLNYTSGLIRVGLMYLNHRKNNDLENIIKEFLKGVDCNFPKNPSYLNGLAGIADTFLDAYNYWGDNFYLERALYKYHVVRLFQLKNHCYPCNKLSTIIPDFNNGMLGILHFYKRLNLTLDGILIHK